MSAYVDQLKRIAKSAAIESARVPGKPPLELRVEAIVGAQTTARIPELQRTLDADPRAIGVALRALGFRRRRVWSGEDYALTQWQRGII